MKYIDDMFEGYLDSEKEYWDYGTGIISGNNIIDTRKTGMSFYDQFFNKDDSEYMKTKKNLFSEIVMMSPEEYYEECALHCWPGKNITPEQLKQDRARDKNIIEKLKVVLTKYKRKFCMPMINYVDPGQEGLHRMYVIGELYGWDFKVPVLQVRHADEDRAKRAAEEKRKSEIDWKVEKAITACYRYEFRDKEELEDQIKYELDRQFEFMDDVKIPDEIHLEETPEAFLLSVSDYEYPIDKEEIRWKEPDDSLDDDIEDLIDISDLEDTEDFLKRYFGDDWRKTHPYLKDTFGIKEKLYEDLNSIVQDVSSYVDKYDSNGSNQNCLFSTWAVELQLRGENFLPRPVYSPRDSIFNVKGEDIIINPKRIKIKSKEDVRTQVLDAGEGARFYCHVNWAGSKGGHEFIVINDNNTVLIVDGQSGYINEIDIDKEYFDDINFENSYIVRLDNKEINQDILTYNDEDKIIEWDDDIDPQLLEEDFSNNNEFFHSLLDELSEFDYAFIDADGEELDDEDAMNATVQHPNQFTKLRKGVCTDFVEYTSEKLSEYNIDHDVYFIKCVDKDGDEPSHVFVVVEDKGKFLWVEAAWHSEAGIHEYNSLEELFEDIARKHCVYEGHNYLESCEIRKVKKSLVGMSQEAIYYYVDTLPITWKATEEGITESLKQIDYLPVSDVELFKEYADDILDGYGNMSDTDIKSSIKEIHFEGKLAGYIGFSAYEENGSKCLGIGNFMIIERGKGLGSAVIQNIVEKYKDQYDLIYCFVDAKNDGAIRLYKKLGKVYDEDGPNDNGEYYVTFWDNGKWELEEDFDSHCNELMKLYESVEKQPELYCISQEDLDGQTLKPRIPDNFFTKNGYEDRKTPRVCFAPTIDQCLMAISQKCDGIEFYVFTPDNVPKESIYKPTVKEVPDSKITDETWITCSVKLKKVGKIKVLGDSGLDGHPFNYGNKTAELYDWDWEWIEN